MEFEQDIVLNPKMKILFISWNIQSKNDNQEENLNTVILLTEKRSSYFKSYTLKIRKSNYEETKLIQTLKIYKNCQKLHKINWQY